MSHQSNLEKALSELADRENSYENAVQDAAQKEHIFKMKQAKEFLQADGNVDTRKAAALVACDKEYFAHLTAEAIRDFTKEKLRDCQAALSARQSLLTASVKSDFGYATDRRLT